MPLHDVTRFSMADMAICSSVLRRSGQNTSSMEQAAGNIVDYLYTHLSDGLGGVESLALVRLFKTPPYASSKRTSRILRAGCWGMNRTLHEMPDAACHQLRSNNGWRQHAKAE